jgi:hypothetical protein
MLKFKNTALIGELKAKWYDKLPFNVQLKNNVSEFLGIFLKSSQRLPVNQ